jgi:hypothetical protein
MLKIINTLIALVVLSTISYSQEIECQNGRCDVVRKVASVAVAPVVTGLQIAKYAPQIILWSSDNPQTKQTKQTEQTKQTKQTKHRQTVCFFSRLKCR